MQDPCFDTGFFLKDTEEIIGVLGKILKITVYRYYCIISISISISKKINFLGMLAVLCSYRRIS